MTESDSAQCSHTIGAEHKAHVGYIRGKNLELVPNEKIVQTWRSLSFKDSDEDSLLTVILKPIKEGTEITLIHNNLTDSETDVEKGWFTHYFEPMNRYFKK